jgi:hypothetical protein
MAVHRDLQYDELNNMAPVDIQAVFFWILEKVDALSTGWRHIQSTPAGCDEDSSPAAMDLFSICPDTGNIIVNPSWYQHLGKRTLGQGRTVMESTDGIPDQCGLLVEWVYGLVVSEGEKLRDNSRRTLSRNRRQDCTSVWGLLHAVLQPYLSQLRVHAIAVNLFQVFWAGFAEFVCDCSCRL